MRTVADINDLKWPGRTVADGDCPGGPGWPERSRGRGRTCAGFGG